MTLGSFANQLVGAILTIIIGFTTFVIYQQYRSKEDKSKLYLNLIRLQRELGKNNSKVEYWLNKRDELKHLKKRFEISEKLNAQLVSLFQVVNGLSIYSIYHQDEYGDIDIEYRSTPDEAIYELEMEYNHGDGDQDTYYQLMDLKKMHIENELKQIIRICDTLMLQPNYMYKEGVVFLSNLVKNYLALEKDKRRGKNLQVLCCNMLENSNVWVNALEEFRELKRINDEIKKKPAIQIKVIEWEKNDFNLLVAYNVHTYLKIEEYIGKLNGYTIIFDQDDSMKDYELLDKGLTLLIDSQIETIGKSLKRTNWLYRGV